MQVNPNTIDTAYVNLTLETPLLWDVDTPNLYKLHARVTDLGVFKTHFVPSDFNTTDGNFRSLRSQNCDSRYKTWSAC